MLSAILVTVLAAPALENNPTRSELRTEHRWLKQHLLDCNLQPSTVRPVLFPQPSPEPGLDVVANHDPVIPNGRGTNLLRIGDKESSRGLYCHAVSRVDVHLPAPGKRFTALVGLDHNEDTARGRGSVVFKVLVKNQAAFQSEVMRYGTPAREVKVDLGRPETFTLEVGDAGDGIGWDQSDWADAKVTMADGRELWLGEMPLRDHRVETGFAPILRSTPLPFSFVYGGQSSDDLLAAWLRKTVAKQLDAGRREHTVTWTDARSGLEVRFVAVEYADYPVVEWTVHFTNTGRADTLILENIQALDTTFERKAGGEFVLHGNKGDWCVPQSYEPYQSTLGPTSKNRFSSDGGRPTNGPKGWPYGF